MAAWSGIMGLVRPRERLCRPKRAVDGPAPSDPGGQRRPDDQSDSSADDVPLVVRCPRCGWLHDWRPHWGCELCDSVFDTFATAHAARTRPAGTHGS